MPAHLARSCSLQKDVRSRGSFFLAKIWKAVQVRFANVSGTVAAEVIVLEDAGKNEQYIGLARVVAACSDTGTSHTNKTSAASKRE
ncbi:hypothetical protein FRUB_05071 [Fimbriiglobus ruber]|uniref:Uncharacterized protein n=1 Tax=Fimbriiglobus ruber TaxID=1908690 RepID=A0A225DF95_9BACT|nr:hypothetical protein FRUB_05071 [Fimbriiglobus ruber]